MNRFLSDMATGNQFKNAVNDGVVEAVEAAEGELSAALDLAVIRTELASDRTLLAWIRTALTLMAAGIAYDKGFRLLHDQRVVAGNAWVHSANFAGILVTGASTVLLVIATLRHVMIARSLADARRRGIGRAVPSLLAAALVILLGCAVIVFLLATG